MTVTRNRAPEGDPISIQNGRLHVPDMPIIPYVEAMAPVPISGERVCASSMPPLNGRMAVGGS